MVDLNNKSILVTGGCGFIGINFLKYVFKKFPDAMIANVDKMGVGSNSNIHFREHMYHLIPRDISIKSELLSDENETDGFDYIFHFAAESHVDRSINDPTQFITNNVNSTAYILEYARRYHSKAKIVCISTDEVYGHLNENDPAFTVESNLNPRSPYAASKAASDLIALAYRTTYGMDISVTRCCNNFGPRQHDEKFIPTVIRNIVNDAEIPVYGNGKNIREWIHVDHHNEAILKVASEINDYAFRGPIFNIGSGVEMTNLDLILYIADIMGKQPKIRFVQDRKAHDFRYAIQNTVYTKCNPQETFRNDMESTIQFYVDKYAGKSPE